MIERHELSDFKRDIDIQASDVTIIFTNNQRFAARYGSNNRTVRGGSRKYGRGG